MKCFYCESEFEIKKTQGGQNRQFCYFCLPENSDKEEREKLKTKLLYQKANKIKFERGCDICGYNKCASALEWHHEGNDKENNPANFMRKGTIKQYQEYEKEIKKCILLCANCHREIHSKE